MVQREPAQGLEEVWPNSEQFFLYRIGENASIRRMTEEKLGALS
jgi:hypothetical protein